MPPALANRHAGVSGQDDADVNHGADLRTIQTILSHADISTTELYTKVSQERIREVLARCHPRANPKHTQMSLFPRPEPILVPGPIICSQCPAPALEAYTYCELHLKLNRERSRRSWRKAHSKKAERPFNKKHPHRSKGQKAA